MLDRQVNLFIVDTNAFLSDEEKAVRTKYLSLEKEKRKKKEELKTAKAEEEITKLKNEISSLSEEIRKERKEAKEKILKLAADAVEYNDKHKRKRIRKLDERYLWYTDGKTGKKVINLQHVISMFESTLTRSLNIPVDPDYVTYDIFILEIYYYDIAQDLIINGFDYDGRHYIYFSSSAGQIRTKKAVFVEEQKYEQCKLKLMCGLTVEGINAQGGMNINKFLAYKALTNSATDLWEDVLGNSFDIDRCIVVDDFETLVKCQVDNIDYQTYEITPGVFEEIPIPHTDGCGMMLPSVSTKNFMVRLPWLKGLLGVFDFKKFIEENGCDPVVVDIWGATWNILRDDIQVIFTKSQLKMWKYFQDWFDYKKKFKENECEACICNIEEDKIPNANINYQMLQTLYDATDEEIRELCRVPNKRIQNVSDGLENALDFFKVKLDEEDNERMNWFRRALKIYPELINDPASRQDLKDLKNSLVKKYRAGKLDVQGKFTFVLPDLYAFCEWLFCKEKVPLGLLENNEVYCRLYRKYDELDCLRSPHLYIEHAIRKNVCDKKYRNQYLRDWFITDAIYTSTYDPISRILQLDVDGDKLLVLAQKKIIEIAKRVTKGVYPLYYEMHKANAEEVNPHNIYKGLELAFTGGRIGGISNDITKIWNSGEITEEGKTVVKWLCFETNHVIDYAKTLFKPTRPDKVDKLIKKYAKPKTPFFFQYAKDKRIDQVEPITDNTINKIVKEINPNRQMFSSIKNLGNVDYRVFLKEDLEYDNEEVNKCFQRWNKKYGLNLSFDDDNIEQNNTPIIIQQIKKDLNEIESDEDKIIISLVRFFYSKPSSRKKRLLWYTYGKELYDNLVKNVGKRNICHRCGAVTTETLIRGKCRECRSREAKKQGYKILDCIDCGKEIRVPISNRRTCRCEECQRKEDNIKAQGYMKKQRQK